MRINNNMMAMNTHRQLGITNGAGSKSMEKLSSGFRINRAGDDAAGLSISEKMRAQVRGLNQASRNSQDGISMIQTAEGALTETHAILQRMRELGTQAANDTNVEIDREAIQNEMNQLSSEINRIGNTTEFNTQSLLKGDGKTSLTGTGLATASGTIGDTTSGVKGTTTHVQAKQDIVFVARTAAELEAEKFTMNIQGQDVTVNFKVDNSLTGADAIKVDKDSATSNSITILVKGNVAAATPENDIAKAVGEGLTEIFKNNETLSGNFTAESATATLSVEAQTKALGGNAYGSKGYIAETANTPAMHGGGTAIVGTTTHVQATHKLDFSSITTKAGAEELIGQGFTVDGKQYEIYNANDGSYTGEAIGLNISSVIDATANWDQALATAVAAQVKGDNFTATAAAGANEVVFTAKALGEEGNGTVKFADGGVQQNFKSNFQVGANQGQSMTIEIGDMRSAALGITGKVGDTGFTSTNSVTNGTNNNSVEAALDVSTHESAAAAVTVINNAIEKVSAQRSELGSFQNRLEHTIKNLETSSENLQASESRIRDVDMAAEMMEFTKNNILQQAAQAMLAQANQQPQGVLQLLR